MKGNKYTEPTIKHAISYLQSYELWLSENPGHTITRHEAFQQSTGVTVPCKAVGLAKKALNVEGWNIPRAIIRLGNGAAGL